MFFPYAVNDEAAPWMQSVCWSCQEYAVHVGAAKMRSMMEPQYLMQAIVQWLNNQVWQYVHEGWSTETGNVSSIIDQDRNWPKGLAEVEACPVGGWSSTTTAFMSFLHWLKLWNSYGQVYDPCHKWLWVQWYSQGVQWEWAMASMFTKIGDLMSSQMSISCFGSKCCCYQES